MNDPIKRLGGEGILSHDDIRQFTKVEKLLVERMKDGEWHSATSIIEWTGQREGLRRLRDLRQKGYVVERMRNGDSRDFHYRLLNGSKPDMIQQTLNL
jgi:hypothetical protein